MLRLIVEIHPHGDETQKRVIGQIDVSNISQGTPECCDYAIEATLDDSDEVIKFVHSGFLRSSGWPSLVARVLDRLSMRRLMGTTR